MPCSIPAIFGASEAPHQGSHRASSSAVGWMGGGLHVEWLHSTALCTICRRCCGEGGDTGREAGGTKQQQQAHQRQQQGGTTQRTPPPNRRATLQQAAAVRGALGGGMRLSGDGGTAAATPGGAGAGRWLAEPQTQTSGGPIADCDEGVGGLSATNTMPPRVSGATGSMRAAAHHPPHLWAGLLHRMHRCMRASSGSGSSRQRERGSARRPGGGRLASPPLEGKQRRCAERWRNTPQRIQPPTLQQQQASRQECRNAGRSTRCCRPLECRRMLRGTAHWRGREQEVMPATATANGWW